MKITQLTVNSSRIFGIYCATLFLLGASAFPPTLRAQESAAPAADTIASLKAEIETLKGKLPGQAHAMADVAYHFCNLYFAVHKENWALAAFYMNEVRSHLKWSARIIPIRKLSSGQAFDVKTMLDELDKAAFAPLAEVIAAKDGAKFRAQYETALNACNSCHVAAEKPYLRMKIPAEPAERLIDFAPAAR
jgi:hypothetical protein